MRRPPLRLVDVVNLSAHRGERTRHGQRYEPCLLMVRSSLWLRRFAIIAAMITGRTIFSRSRSTLTGIGAGIGIGSRIGVIAVMLIISMSAGALLRHTLGWRRWSPEEVQVAFWGWHSHCPGEEDVRRAVNQARAQILFLRAGQIDVEGGKLRRIRAVTGRFPTGIELHLVYNSTRSCLAEFERLSPSDLASALCKAYQEDAARAAQDQARVAGVQCDIDVPTRLLPAYTKALKQLREMLPPGSKLSITGLPTWMDSASLVDTLSTVDFWIPQCYGATIPQTLSRTRSQPVSSPKQVAAAIARARLLHRPYYAGLAAYGYAIHYGPGGSLIELRGDLDPALVAANSNLELVSRDPFEQGDDPELGSGWRCLYHARNDDVIDGTAIRAGDYLMLDISTSTRLREGARIAREQGGDLLLGICVFRLPRQDDPATLTIREVASALRGERPAPSSLVETELEGNAAFDGGIVLSRVKLRIVNDGSASSVPGDGAMKLVLRVPGGCVRSVSVTGFTPAESYRDDVESYAHGNEAALRSCSLRRARVLTMTARSWRPGQKATAVIEFAGEAPETLSAILTVNLDDGQVLHERKTLELRMTKPL